MSKTFVITGGTGGLGTALVRRLIGKDYRLAVTYLLPDEAQEFESEFEVDEKQLTLTRVDCTNPEAVNTFIKQVADKWGGIHGL
ncbi:MAG TPA: SDR family NAD(P)-dependent oxidoreductase, partial [Acidimicrobiia bacterium]